MIKNYLLTPGPTPIPESVLSLSSQPILHHRTPEFSAIFKDVKVGLKYLFQTKQDVLMLTCSGTGAMEATISNLFSCEDSVITINAGKFGERWTKLATAYGLKPIELKYEPGQTAKAEDVRALLVKHPEVKGVLFQASETSTGAKLPTKEICEIVREKKNCISVVDAITALGVFELPMDAWSIDVLITGSQKALMLPPGLACISLSEKAWLASKSSDLPKFYFNLEKERKASEKEQTTWTPAISLIVGLKESLRMIQSEGLENTFKRHRLLSEATRNAVRALGLELLSESPSEAVTAVKVPSQIKEGKKIPKLMREKYGVSIAGGQDELEGKIFRLTHLGYVGIFDIVIGISALEMALQELGMDSFELGAGVGAVLKTQLQSG